MPLRFKDYVLYESLGEINKSSEYYKKLVETFGENPPLDKLNEDWYSKVKEGEYKDFISNVEKSKYNDCECVILGNLNFITHIVGIKPIRCKSLSEAFKTCLANYTNITVRLTNGYIQLDVIYSNGVNNYEIHLLNNKGINLQDGDYSKPCYHKSIRGKLF